ncbi:MAG: cobalt transport protein CbiN [Oscillospiraceae bacterium]|nr:cobalt transport protein CbiN [Oscillospiraceae bacterium]
MKKKDRVLFLILILCAVVLIVLPLILQRGAEFGGSDDAGSGVVEEISGGYTPWATPVLELFLGGEMPGELESLMFCVQTGIGVGVMMFFIGRFVERKKQQKIYGSREDMQNPDVL